MIRHREGSRRDEGRAPSSLPDLAVALRRARTRQGLRVEDVSGRTAIPTTQLEALESGTADLLADQIVTVRALRRYADFLGLPGDQYALVLVDVWPGSARPAASYPETTSPAGGPSVVTVIPAAGVVAAAPTVTGPPTVPPPTASATTSLFVPPAAAPTYPDDTGGVPAVPGGIPAAGSPTSGATPMPEGVRYVTGTVPAYTSQVPVLIPDTGVTPAVPGRAAATRPRGGGTFLRVLIGLVGLLLILGLTGLGINHWRPQLLRTLHLPHSAIATTTTTTPVDHPTGTTAPKPSVFTVTSSSPIAVTATVRAPAFTLSVTPVGGSSWVQVSDGSHATPVFSQVVAPLQNESFPNEKTVTVQVGSSSARIFFLVHGKVVGFFFPTTAPFSVTVSTVT